MTQIAADGQADNSTVTIESSSSSYNYFINAIHWSFFDNGGGGGACSFYVTNAADTVQYYFALLNVGTDENYHGSLSFPIPLVIPGDYKIKVTSDTADVIAHGFVHGHKEAV